MAVKQRSIFEEVGAGARPAATRGGMIASADRGARGAVRIWLMVLFALVMAMILVGGLTRLTDSGLSITEWRPVAGALPPLNAADWASEFAKYQASPQYKLLNDGMSLGAFKAIYWWEWGHRQLGRVIGLVWALGFFGFLLAGRMPRGWTGRMLLIGVLGGLQGAVGWWMVSSGLTGAVVSVASYRLAVHLGLAFTILGLIANYVFLLGRTEGQVLQARRLRLPTLRGWTTALLGLAFVQILLGALVAGIDAGRGYPTWPLMNGQFFPADAFYVPGRPLWAAFFENPGLVQFDHRMSGYLLFAAGIAVFLMARRTALRSVKRAYHAMIAMMVVQVALGIGTALSGAELGAAITHQVGAVVLWVLIVRARVMAGFPVQGSVREGTA